MRNYITHLITHTYFERGILFLICVNAIILGLETYPPLMQSYGDILHLCDVFFIVIFAAELLIKLYVYRMSFFQKGWNIFDASVVTLTLIPFVGNVSALRAVRILRALRLISSIPSFRHVIEGIINSAREFDAVLGVLLVVCYIYAVIGAKLFHTLNPERFGDMHTALFTLFQIMTLDGWSDIVRPLMEHSYTAAPYFVSFIILTVFMLLSIVIGIASNAISKSAHAEPATKDDIQELKDLIETLRK